MYETFFNLRTLPFSLTPNTQFFCELKGHQAAFNTLTYCITHGEGFIKIVGEVGTGKTLLLRKLIDSLQEPYVTAYLPNPDLTPVEIRKAFARELGIDPAQAEDQHELVTVIYKKLIQNHAQGKRVILLIDEAQALSDESLETVRLLTNLETAHSKLLQVVLFGQPELDERLNQANLRQLKQRISFSYRLPGLTRADLDIYLHHRLAVAGYTHGDLFSKKVKNRLYQASGGIPRLVNILAHKALLAAYGRHEKTVSMAAMKLAIQDTESIPLSKGRRLLKTLTGLIMAATFFSVLIYLT